MLKATQLSAFVMVSDDYCYFGKMLSTALLTRTTQTEAATEYVRIQLFLDINSDNCTRRTKCNRTLHVYDNMPWNVCRTWVQHARAIMKHVHQTSDIKTKQTLIRLSFVGTGHKTSLLLH